MVFYLLIIVMALMAAALAVIANAVNTMYFQTNSRYIKAYERNLKASGAAWAKQIIKNNDGENLDKLVQLDVNDLNIRDSVLSVKINGLEVEIDTLCGRGRQRLRHKYSHKIEP